MYILSGSESADNIRQVIHEHGLAMLSVACVGVLLKKFSSGQLDAATILQIADELENDAVIYERGKEEIIATILFELSSPEVNGPLTLQRCSELISKFSL